MNGTGDAVEPGVKRDDYLLRRGQLRQLSEAAEVGKKQGGPYGLTGFAPQPAGEHLRRAAPAEIGRQQRRQGRTRAQQGKRGCSKACNFTQ